MKKLKLLILVLLIIIVSGCGLESRGSNINILIKWENKIAQSRYIPSTTSKIKIELHMIDNKELIIEKEILNGSNINSSAVTIEDLDLGLYFIKIIAVDANGNILASAENEKFEIVKGNNYIEIELKTLIPIEKIVVKEEICEVLIGTTLSLSAEIFPNNSSEKNIIWSSLNEKIATVDHLGNIKGISLGETTIIVSGEGKNFDQIKIIVIDDTVLLEKIEIIEGDQIIDVGDGVKLSALLSPSDASDIRLVWRSSDDKIVSISQNGTILALKAGTVTIEVLGGNNIVDSISVVVKEKIQIIELESVEIVSTISILNIGDKRSLSAQLNPSNIVDKSILWETGDSSIISIDQDGNIEALKEGQVIISASSASKKDSITITVLAVFQEIEVTDVVIDKTILEMNIDEEITVVATVVPDNATNKTLTWISSDDTIATVSQDGKIKALSEGIVEIKASSGNGFVAKVNVTVSIAPIEIEVSEVSLNKDNLEMNIGDIITVSATIVPDNALNKVITWSSSNNIVATVTQDGKIEALLEGTSEIIASSNNGKIGIVRVTVVDPLKLSGIEIINTVSLIQIGETIQMQAKLVPNIAIGTSIVWGINDGNISSIDAYTGLLRGLGDGKVNVTASCKDASGNEFIDTFELTIRPQVTHVDSIKIKQGDIRMFLNEEITLEAVLDPDDSDFNEATWSINSVPSSAVEVLEENLNTYKIKALGEGTVVVTATAEYSVDTIIIKMVERDILDKIDLNFTESLIKTGESLNISADITPSSSLNYELEWTSSDESVIKIQKISEEEVSLIAVGAGTAEISVSDGLVGTSARFTVKDIIAESFEIDSIKNLVLGKTIPLNYTVLPTGYTDYSLSYVVSDENIAKIESINGILEIEGISLGTVEITLSTENIFKKISLEVIPDQIESLDINLGDNFIHDMVSVVSIPYVVSPSGITINSEIWETSNSAVASVDASGVITTYAEGDVTITLTVNGISDSVNMQIGNSVPNVFSIFESTSEVAKGYVGHDIQLNYILEPVYIDHKIMWESNDATIAVVDQNGLITGIGAGTTIVTASYRGVLLEVSVAIGKMVETVTLSTPTEIKVGVPYNFQYTVTPVDATICYEKWESSDTTIGDFALIDSNTFTPINRGNVNIKVTVYCDNFSFTNELSVEVISPQITFVDSELETAIRGTTGFTGSTSSGAIMYESDILGITSLDLTGRSLSSLEGISQLINLQNLNLSDISEVYNLNGFNELLGLATLKILKLNNVSLNDSINGLSTFYQLEELYINHNSIPSIEAIKDLSNLKIIDVSDNSISDAEPLEELSKLEELYINNNSIIDIEAIEDLSNLKIVDVSYNSISDAEPLEELSKLEELYINNNSITDIEAIEDLSNLKIVDVSYNSISDAEPLKGLSKLEKILIQENVLVDISNISILNHPNLVELNITNNTLLYDPSLELNDATKEIVEQLKIDNVTVTY